MAIIFEYVQECMNVFVDMHGRVDKPIVSISFENVLRTEEIEKEQETLMKEACLSIFVHQRNYFSWFSRSCVHPITIINEGGFFFFHKLRFWIQFLFSATIFYICMLA
jgi:hypothetical protein